MMDMPRLDCSPQVKAGRDKVADLGPRIWGVADLRWSHSSHGSGSSRHIGLGDPRHPPDTPRWRLFGPRMVGILQSTANWIADPLQ